jgi:hypothetical protein
MFATVKRLAGYDKTSSNFTQVLVRGAGTLFLFMFYTVKRRPDATKHLTILHKFWSGEQVYIIPFMFNIVKRLAGYFKTSGNITQVLVRGAGKILFLGRE